MVILFYGCSQSGTILNGISSSKWKLDRNGCNGYRETIEKQLASELEKLKGLSEVEILNALGRPDQNELYVHNQKFYSYWISCAPTCENYKSNPHRLTLRLTSIGIVQSAKIFEVNDDNMK